MEQALPSLKERPILADIGQLNDGSYDFFSHDFTIDEDSGEVLYEEFPIGVTQDTENAHLEYDEERDVYFVVVNGVIWEEYGNQAADIIRRKNGTKVSVELSISDLSFNSKEKYLEINDFYFSGITCLGTNPETGKEIQEGMEGSRLDLSDFSEQNNSIFAGKEGGDPVEENIREEESQIQEETQIEDEMQTQTEEPETVYQLILGEHTFEYDTSMNDIIAALNELVNVVYSDADCDWYSVTVYNDYLIMYGMWNGRAYKQSYSESEGVYTLTGDREEVYMNYLTKEEEDKLADMRANYDALVQFKADTEAAAVRAEKEVILSDEKYAVIADTEAFKALKSDMDKYDKEDLAIRAKALLGDYYSNFAAHEEPRKKVGIENNPAKVEDKPYGNLFD